MACPRQTYRWTAQSRASLRERRYRELSHVLEDVCADQWQGLDYRTCALEAMVKESCEGAAPVPVACLIQRNASRSQSFRSSPSRIWAQSTASRVVIGEIGVVVGVVVLLSQSDPTRASSRGGWSRV